MKLNLEELSLMSKNLKLLYVEDNKDAREATFQLLSNFFKDITVAVDGQDGFEKFQQNKFDLIISDINMPIMGGVEALENIIKFEKENNIPHIPIIALTANAMGDDKQKYKDMGFDGYLCKPVDEDELLKILNQYIGAK